LKQTSLLLAVVRWGSYLPVIWGDAELTVLSLSKPDLVRLFPNHHAAEHDYFARTGLFPIMHFVAIRSDVHEANPGVSQALYTTLCRAKEEALKKFHYAGANILMSPFLAADVEKIDELFDGDPFPYGIECNRATIETIIRYMVEQDYIPDTIPVEDLFYRSKIRELASPNIIFLVVYLFLIPALEEMLNHLVVRSDLY